MTDGVPGRLDEPAQMIRREVGTGGGQSMVEWSGRHGRLWSSDSARRGRDHGVSEELARVQLDGDQGPAILCSSPAPV